MKIKEQTEVARIDELLANKDTQKNKAKFDLIMIDPPYDKLDYTDILNEIMKRELLNDGGLIYCEHGTTEDLPSNLEELQVIKQMNYGQTTGITIYLNGIDRKSVV